MDTSTRRLLFVCSRNGLRSPTAEQVFGDWPGIETASAGVDHDADTPLTPELLRWAHIVFVMEPAHRSKLSRRFRAHLDGTRIICLGIRDDYAYMQAELIDLLRSKVPPHLPRR